MTRKSRFDQPNVPDSADQALAQILQMSDAELDRSYTEMTGKVSPRDAVYRAVQRVADIHAPANSPVASAIKDLLEELKPPQPGAALAGLWKMAAELREAAILPTGDFAFAFREMRGLSDADRSILEQQGAGLLQDEARASRAFSSFPRQLANAVRDEFDAGDVPDVEWLCCRLGLRVCEVPATSFEGALVQTEHGHRARILLRQRIPSPERRRFTIAHEVGHFILNAHDKKRRECSTRSIGSLHRPENRSESQADEFAAELLMPRDRVSRMIDPQGPTLANIKEIADHFRTSMTASACQYLNTSEFKCALVKSEGPNVFWRYPSIPTEKFPYLLDDGKSLPAGAVIRRQLEGTRVCEGMHKVPPSTWLTDEAASRVSCLYEDSRVYSKSKIGLTLLWVP